MRISSATMAPDPFDLASIHLLLHKQQSGKHPHPRSSSLSKLLPSASSSAGGNGSISRRHCKCKSKSKSRSRSSSKMPLHYLKPGALAQLRDAQRSTRFSSFSACCGKKKKRIGNSVDEDDDVRASPAQELARLPRDGAGRDDGLGFRIVQARTPEIAGVTLGPAVRVFGPLCPQRKKLLAPRTPLPPPIAAPAVPITPASTASPPPSGSGGESLLESLPLELLVRIVCSLHHDQLKPAFHVSRRLRQAVLIARQCHFDFTTPSRERHDALLIATPRVDSNWQFSRANAAGAGPSRPPTPKAPRPAQKPLKARISFAEMQQLAGPLFHGSGNRLGRVKPPSLSRAAFRAVASHRVLFYEEELCQAVAQNSI